MSDIIIRNYRKSDLEKCRNLWIDLTRRHRDLYKAPGIGGDDPGQYFDEHLEKVGSDNIWLAELEDRVVGMIGLELDNEGSLVIEPIVVHPNFRDRGIGIALLNHMKKVAKERKSEYLSIKPVARNVEAMELFHKAGFINLGHIEMFIDFSEKKDKWKSGIRIHELDCRY